MTKPVLIGLESCVVGDEKVYASERGVRLASYFDMAVIGNRHILKHHDFSILGVEMLMKQSNADTLGDIVFVEQLSKILEIPRLSVYSCGCLADQRQSIVYDGRDEGVVKNSHYIEQRKKS